MRVSHSRRRPPADWRPAACGFALAALVLMSAVLAFQQAFLTDLPRVPDREALWSLGRPRGITFLSPDGQVIARRGPRHGARLELGRLPAHVAWAFLAVEDKRFYEHGAIDLRGIARAALVNLRAGRVVEGGSTLTQQLARTLFLSPDQSLKRKVQEILLARAIERRLTKDEILELYLNRIYFGDRAYGLAAAAEVYFGKQAKDLTLPEAALLAGLPKAPSLLSPTHDLAAAWARGRLVLDTLATINWITPTEARLAKAQVPALVEADDSAEGDLAWIYDAAVRDARVLVGDGPPDLVIQVTADPAMQAAAAGILRQALARRGSGARQAALVALAPDGAIRAMVGGLDHDRSSFNRAYQARRQPGSAFKPFVWAAALEDGAHPYDMELDGPIRIGNWRPQNFGGGYRGEVTLASALRLSLNTVSVRLTEQVGPGRVAELARRFGLAEIPRAPGPSVALGAYEVSLLELTGAYQVLQSGGERRAPYLISRITNARGDVLYARQASPGTPVFDRVHAGQMVQMMQGVIRSGTGIHAAIGRPAAGKTGTSQDFRDAWFVGFTPDWAAGVWVGNDNNRPMSGVTGGKLPAEIWRRFMQVAHRGLPPSRFDWMPWSPPSPQMFDLPMEEDSAEPPAIGEDEPVAGPSVPYDSSEAPDVAAWPGRPSAEPAPEARGYVPPYGFSAVPGGDQLR